LKTISFTVHRYWTVDRQIYSPMARYWSWTKRKTQNTRKKMHQRWV